MGEERLAFTSGKVSMQNRAIEMIMMMTDMMKYASLLSGTCYILLTISLYPTKLSNFDQVMRLYAAMVVENVKLSN